MRSVSLMRSRTGPLVCVCRWSCPTCACCTARIAMDEHLTHCVDSPGTTESIELKLKRVLHSGLFTHQPRDVLQVQPSFPYHHRSPSGCLCSHVCTGLGQEGQRVYTSYFSRLNFASEALFHLPLWCMQVRVLHGRWQDVAGELEQYDGIFFDTYSEHYLHMREFHELVAKILRKDGIYTFFNGLAPRCPFFSRYAANSSQCCLSASSAYFLRPAFAHVYLGLHATVLQFLWMG